MTSRSGSIGPAALPLLWWLFILALFIGGLALFRFSPAIPTPVWITRASNLVPADKWPALVGIYIVGLTTSHFVIHWSLVFLARIFRLKPDDDPQSTYYPVAFVGFAEAILYPTTFLVGKPEFIGVWLALKVAGQWKDWTSGYQGRALFNRFLVGSALSIIASGLVYGAIKSLVLCAGCPEVRAPSPTEPVPVGFSTWDTSTWASVISAAVTTLGIGVIVWFEWYRRPRLHVRPSRDRPTEEWIHLTVCSAKPRWWFLPRDIAVDCTARVSFLEPTTKQQLVPPVPQITAHWVNQPEPFHPSHMPVATTRNVGFRDEMIDVLRRLPDGTAYAADPWKVYAAWPPSAAPPGLQAEFEERRLKQREHIVRVELEPANGWCTEQEFRLALPAAGMGAVMWTPREPHDRVQHPSLSIRHFVHRLRLPASLAARFRSALRAARRRRGHHRPQ